ncbi:MAG: HAMP domain-containing methyl-accepting chemotaxis protein [Candidatus Sericytochromatia bacterium]
MKLSISSKVAGVIIALCIPISALTYLNVCEKNSIASINSKEIEANDYLFPMIKTLQDLSKHNLISYKKKSSSGISDKTLLEIRANIDQNIIELESIDNKYGKSFDNLSNKISSLKSEWSKIKTKSNSLSTNQIDNIHKKLIKDLRDLIIYTGNISKFELSSKFVSSYLSDTALLKIPAISDYIYQLQYLIEQTIIKKDINSNDKIKIASLSSLIRANIDELNSVYEMPYLNSIDKNIKNELSDSMISTKNSIKKYLDYVNSSIVNSNSKLNYKDTKTSDLSSKALNETFDNWSNLINVENKLLNEKVDKLKSDTFLLTTLIVLFTLLSIISAIFIISGIVRSIKALNNTINQNKNSNFTAKTDIKTGDELEELGLSFNEMINNIHSLISDSENTKKIVVNNSANFESLVKETSTSVSQIKQNSEVVSDNARIVAEAASISVSISSDGEKAVNESIQGVEKIKSQIEEVATKILELSAQTKAIGKIISTVDDISKQSRILAFNASIEASKAGEYGKGFSIVANEIKNLSDESKEATKKISTILSEIQGLTNKSVMLTEDATKLADIGVNLSKVAGSTITKLVDSIQNSSEAAYQISSSAIEQKTSLEQLEESMRKISFVSKN